MLTFHTLAPPRSLDADALEARLAQISDDLASNELFARAVDSLAGTR
jgi:hypothetical protein